MFNETISDFKNILSISLLKQYGIFKEYKNITAANILLHEGGLGVIFEKDGIDGYLKIFVNGKDIIANRLDTRDYGCVILLTVTKCNYGGYRWWFICPGSGKKCLNLYFKDGKFYSRDYLKLYYPEQLYSKKKRELDNGLWKYNKQVDEIKKTIKYPQRKGIKTKKERRVYDLKRKCSNENSRNNLVRKHLNLSIISNSANPKIEIPRELLFKPDNSASYSNLFGDH